MFFLVDSTRLHAMKSVRQNWSYNTHDCIVDSLSRYSARTGALEHAPSFCVRSRSASILMDACAASHVPFPLNGCFAL